MTARIVRTSDTLHGRWRLDGTRLPVSLFKRCTEAELLDGWPYLTPEQIAAAKAFEVPAVHAIAVPHIHLGDLNARCRCGEDLEADVRRLWCPLCGRVYRVSVKLTETTAQSGGKRGEDGETR